MPRIPPKLISSIVKGGKAITRKVAESEDSSASKKLVGMFFRDEKWPEHIEGGYIKRIAKRSDNVRVIELEDGRLHPVTTDELEKITTIHRAEVGRQQAYGTADYASDEFEETALERGIRTLKNYLDSYEMGTRNPMWTKKMIRDMNKEYQKTIAKTGMKVDPYVLVDFEGQLVPLNGREARSLVNAGIVKFHRWQGSASGTIKKAE